MFQVVKHLLVALFLVLALASFSSSALAESSEGPGSGGGGGVIAVGDHYYLIDFLNIFSLDELVSISQERGDFQARPAVKSFSLVRNQPAENESFQAATDIFKQWEKVPFNTITEIMADGLYAPLKWSFVEQGRQQLRYFRPTALSPQSPVVTAAYYKMSERNFNVKIDRNIWNRIPRLHQIGLVIHEGLRQVQFASFSHFDDETLQKATAIMVLCKPSVKLSQYLGFLILNQPALAEARLGSFESVTTSCREAL